MLRNSICSVAIGLTLTLAGCGAEPPDGSALAQAKGCIACHGQDGRASAAIYPNLNGQWPDYLRVQLLKYRSGRRENAIMNGMAASLSDEEIRALADHYGR